MKSSTENADMRGYDLFLTDIRYPAIRGLPGDENRTW
jgi:hypothetical protein